MDPAETSSANERLCSRCGLCCNGVLFHRVQLQPGDSAKALAALGLKLKRKQGRHFLLQPCPAHKECRCLIYPLRPERCRLFECRQLKRLATGEITEAMALGKIQMARALVDRVNALLQEAGTTNPKRPLFKRWEKAMAEPQHPAVSPEASALQDQLRQAMEALRRLLNDEFRIIRTEPRAGEEFGPATAG